MKNKDKEDWLKSLVENYTIPNDNNEKGILKKTQVKRILKDSFDTNSKQKSKNK